MFVGFVFNTIFLQAVFQTCKRFLVCWLVVALASSLSEVESKINHALLSRISPRHYKIDLSPVWSPVYLLPSTCCIRYLYVSER